MLVSGPKNALSAPGFIFYLHKIITIDAASLPIRIQIREARWTWRWNK
jgi:hypothetical protein